MGAGHYSSPGGGGRGGGVGGFWFFNMINWLNWPHNPSPHIHTHTYTLIGCYWQSIFYSPLFILYANSPSTPFILLKKYYLWWNHLSTPCGFTLVLASFLWAIRLQTKENCVWFVKYHFEKYQNKNKKAEY